MFEEVVRYAGQALSSITVQDHNQPVCIVETGVIPPRYLAACKRRHPWTRSKLLAVFQRVPLHESMWAAMPTAGTIGRVVAIEEDASCPDVEEQAQEVAIELSLESRRLHHLVCVQMGTVNGTALCGSSSKDGSK